MQIIINFGALIAISAFLSIRYHDSLVQTLPVTLCSIGAVLYVLAFFHRLHWITAILAAGLLFLCVVFLREVRRAGFRQALRTACGPFREPQFWINAAALVIIVLLVNYRQILEWDAYNFWGPDIKSLYYRNGFAGRLSNVSSAYGDYPPNVQLMIWWFLHSFGRFDEGLLFGGSYFYGYVLLFSLTDRIRLKRPAQKIAVGALSTAVLVLLPSVVDTSWYRTLCVDPLMAILWGCLLCAVVLEHACTDGFQYYKCLVFLSAITLTKSIGFLWAVFGIVCYLLWRGAGKAQLLRAGGMAAVTAGSYVSWSVFCTLMERTTYLTNNLTPSVSDRLQEVVQGTFLTSGNNLTFIKAYIKAFLFEPAHRADTWAADLTPVMVMVLLFAAFWLFFRSDWLPRKRMVRMGVFLLGVYGIIHFVLLSAHLTIFSGETQYLEAANMVTTMTRYGSPANLGFLMLSAAICLEHLELPQVSRDGRVALPLLGALLVVCCAGYPAMADCMVEGHDPLNPQRIEKRAQFVDMYADLLDEIAQVPLTGERQKVLLLCSAAEYNPIVTFHAAPVAVEVLRYNGDLTAEALWEAVDRLGVSWVFVQDGTGDELTHLGSILSGCELHTLYPLSTWRAIGD